MSDARDKLQAAIEAKKKGGGGKASLPKIPKAKSAPAPAPSKPAPVTNRSTGPAEKPKPEKAKSSFLKKKKKAKPKAKPSGKKSGGGFGDVFGKIAKNFVDELKEATSEISPEKLISSAKDGISNLGIGRSDDSPAKDASSPQKSDRDEISDPTPVSAATNGVNPTPSEPETPKEFSSVKVQKAPPARRKRKPSEGAEAEPVTAEEPVLAPDDAGEVSPAADADAGTAESGDDASVASSASVDSTPAESVAASPAQVKRATKKKEKSDEPKLVEGEEAEPTGIVQDEPSAEAAEPVAAGDTAEPDPQESSEPAEEASPEPAAAAEAPKKEDSGGDNKKSAKPAPKQNVQVSKEEQLIRAFHSLHTILNSNTWSPIATQPNSKPSSVFAPRQHFDTQWSAPAFRDGLKAASRLASGFTFDPSGAEFDQVAIDAVKNYPFDPQNMIKPHTELITKAIGSEKTAEVLELVKKGKIRKLLYSVGTRLGTFVPTIEILARIYIGLRKKEDMIPGTRLQIQEEVVMKYSKSPYTEDMGKKARNLSLNYFMDYLTEYGFKLYKDRMEQAPEGQNHFSAQKRRHTTITDSCVNLVREWGTKVGVSTPALMNLEGRLMEMTDSHLSALVGEVPDDEGDE